MPRSLLSLVFAAVLAGCGSGAPVLSHSAASPDALARDVLNALAAGDRDTLAGLAVSEGEFRELVWPDLPAARPERNLPFAYVWGDLHQKSEASLGATIAARRGRRATLERVRFGEVTPYASYTVHRDAVFVVRHPDGTTEDLKVCGSFLERQGQWKVFSYVTND